jgi:hypothetical protein
MKEDVDISVSEPASDCAARRIAFMLALALFSPSARAVEDPPVSVAPLLKIFSAAAATNAANPDATLDAVARRLRDHFDAMLADPIAYRRRARRECEVFPEGKVYPFAIPALAYANLGLKDPPQRDHSAAQMRKLIDILRSIVTEKIRPPGADLNRLSDYQKQGTYLATLNLALACYALVSNDGRYGRLRDHLSLLLRDALVKNQGEPLASYPDLTWYFDTVMALVSLEMHERLRGPMRTRPLLDQYLAWVRSRATDAESGLPIAYEGGLPRGCDLTMQICLLAQIDPPLARRLYADFVAHHWVDYGFIAGFREWPKSKKDSNFGDVDSGPLFLGIGPTATGVGMGAALAVNDTNLLARLAGQLDRLPAAIQLLEKGGQKLFGEQVLISSQYETGFLYGDAVLFYAVTWVPYPKSGAPR